MLAVVALAVSASSLLITLVLVWGVGHMVLSLDDRIDAVREAFTRRGDADARDRETIRSQLREWSRTIREHGAFIEQRYPVDARRLDARADSGMRRAADTARALEEIERRIADDHNRIVNRIVALEGRLDNLDRLHVAGAVHAAERHPD